ncbi:MAG: alpha/beta hydrolase-fold protein [Verrucomicrobiota bacterium]
MKSLFCFLFAVALAVAQTEAPMTAAEKKVDAKLSPSLQPIVDVPGLPRVLLVGDSVSMGYTLRVRTALQGQANVHRVPTNCGPSSKGGAEIDRWLGDSRWDVIHFNFGLHDVRYVKPGEINVPRERYEANLRTIVARLKRTGATLIWAATTPVPAKNRPGQYPRVQSDIGDYNAIAARVMKENGVTTNDLYAAVLPRIAELQPADDVHFNSKGSDVLGERVAAAIAAALPTKKKQAALDVTEPRVTEVEPRVWACDFMSKALGEPMRFLVVLPEGASLKSAPLPVIYFLHGRGRHERTLFEYETTKQRVLASRCAVVLPRGKDGWYVNSPAIPKDRYADYVDEVITLAEKYFPVGRTPQQRAIGGWSMGGYGAAYTAVRRAGDFAAVAPVIGILDYPRPDIAEPGQNYAIQPRFGSDPAVWERLNPRRLIAALRGVPVFVAYADKAAERQMNEAFIADAQSKGVALQFLKMSGGHTFPMVEQGLPPAFAFMEKALLGAKREGFTTVKSLDELREHLTRDGAKVRLAPGTYRLDTAKTENFLHFTGNDSHFDFTGARIEVDTALLARFKKEGTNMLMLTGDRIVLEGGEIETVGGQPPGEGTRGISISGNGVIVRDVTLRLAGSYPYGYGSFFGIGQGAAISPQKMSGIRVGGLNDQVINCRVFMRCFGHAIFIRGGQKALIKDCYIEGALRKTDDILAEKSGPAFDQKFMQYTGEPIPAGEMTSLSEDGIRAYPDDPLIKRRTQDIRVENCRVVRMRRAICLAFAAGENSIVGCEVTEAERAGYHISSNTTVRDCRGDALYSQVLDISSSGAKNAVAEVTVLDSRARYGHTLLAKINGTGHRVQLKEVSPGAVPRELTLELGTDRGFGEGRMKDAKAGRVEVINRTAAPVILHEPTSECVITTATPVTDRGQRNRTVVLKDPARESAK